MWFPILSILLITIPNLQGNQDITLPIKELHYKISKTVAKIVEESKVLPDPSELELAEKTKKVLEEYIQIDISSGLPEQIELLELKEKADDLKTSKETQKAILDGLDLWGIIRKFEKDEVTELDSLVADELSDMEKKRKDTVNDAYSKLDYKVEDLRIVIERAKVTREDAERKSHGSERVLLLVLKTIGIMLEDFERQYSYFFDGFDKIDKHPISFDFVEVMKNVIAEGKKKSAEIRKWNEDSKISQKILSVKGEIQVMEELRDSEAIQRILGLIDKLEGSYEGIQASGLERLQWKIDYSFRKMTPIRNHLKTLKISSGDLTEPLKKIESCLQNYEFSMDFSTEEEGVMKIEEDLKEVRAKDEQFLEVLDKVEKFRKVEDSLKELGNYCKEKYPLWSKSMELVMELEQNANLTLVSEVPKLDTQVSEIRDLLNKVNFEGITTVSNAISIKISKIKEFLNCHSTLGTVSADIKSLMDQPEKVWNFDPRSLQYALQVVYLFKEAHRFLVDQKPVTANRFPLTLEEVSEVSEGFRILEAILNFQKFWAKNSGKFSSTLADQLSHVKDISKIQFSPDPHLDSIINFYNSTQYQGGQRRKILKTLESVKDTSEFAVKLEKMNEAIRKYLGPEPQVIEEEEFIDCFENTCPLLSLPEVIRKNL